MKDRSQLVKPLVHLMKLWGQPVCQWLHDHPGQLMHLTREKKYVTCPECVRLLKP